MDWIFIDGQTYDFDENQIILNRDSERIPRRLRWVSERTGNRFSSLR
jgi:hypothetical protein